LHFPFDVADDPKPESKQTDQPRSRLLLVVVAVLLVVAAGGAIWLFSRRAAAQSSQRGNTQTAGRQQEHKVKSVLHLESFTVNLADAEQNSFLRVGIDLGLSEELPESKGSEKGSPLTPRIRDTLLTVLTTWQSNALLAPDGKAKLKQELGLALQERVPELGVIEVYFTDFLVQR
jgi:flagellar FliL protein